MPTWARSATEEGVHWNMLLYLVSTQPRANLSAVREAAEVLFSTEDIEVRHVSTLQGVVKPSEEYRVVTTSPDASLIEPALSTWGRPNWFFVHMGEWTFPLDDAGIERVLRELARQGEWATAKDLNGFVCLLDRLEHRTQLRARPTSLQLETTNRCNASCVMCNHLYSSEPPDPDFSRLAERLDEVIPYLRMILLHGNGEPFLAPDIADRIRVFHDYGIALTTNTNLSVLNDELLELLNSCFFEVRVSCDGCSRRTYEGIRRGLSFDRFVTNARLLRDRTPRLRKVMVAVLMRQNLTEVADLVDFAADLGFSELSFQELGTNAVIGNQGDSPRLFPHLAANQFREAVLRARELGVRLSYPGLVDLTLEDDQKLTEETERAQREPLYPSTDDVTEIRRRALTLGEGNMRPIERLDSCSWQDGSYRCRGICSWCVERPYVDTRGNVFPCCINATYSLGNIFEHDSFLELWNDDLYQQVRASFHEERLPAFCEGCQFLSTGSTSYVRVLDHDPLKWVKRHVSGLYLSKRDYLGKEGGNTHA